MLRLKVEGFNPTNRNPMLRFLNISQTSLEPMPLLIYDGSFTNDFFIVSIDFCLENYRYYHLRRIKNSNLPPTPYMLYEDKIDYTTKQKYYMHSR